MVYPYIHILHRWWGPQLPDIYPGVETYRPQYPPVLMSLAKMLNERCSGAGQVITV
jgi:hypothetical protein